MKLGEPIYAIVDPDTGNICGNGDAPALYSYEPDRGELNLCKAIGRHERVEVRRVRVVEVGEGEPPAKS